MLRRPTVVAIGVGCFAIAVTIALAGCAPGGCTDSTPPNGSPDGAKEPTPTVEPTSTADAHPKYEAGQACVECHEDPHGAPYKDRACDECHSLEDWTASSFVHETRAMSTGFHAVIACSKCHEEGQPGLPPSHCYGCHQGRPHEGPVTCEDCHTPSLWRLVNPPSDHFTLAGGHSGLSCFQCHNRTLSPGVRCANCHGSMHGGLTNCEDCHTPTGFKPSTFRHSSVFALVGKHLQVPCNECHVNGEFANVPGTRCTDCHGTAHGGLTNCEDCHTPTGFKPSSIDHAAFFPLSGKHSSVDCRECHTSGDFFKPLARTCVACHGARHGGLTDCADCHTTAGFAPSTFDHATAFALVGKHAELGCDECHPDRKFAQVAGSACVDCHGVKHGGQTVCKTCHEPFGWVLVEDFLHEAAFSLNGAHAAPECWDCHPGLDFSYPVPAGSDCLGCHEPAPHVGPENCVACHTPTVWSNVFFTHVPMSYHQDLGINGVCQACHTTGNYADYTCSICHPDGRTYDPDEDL